MEKKEKQKFKNQIILNVILIIIFSFVSYYLFLQNDDLSVKIKDSNELYTSYLDLNNNWVSVSDLAKVSSKYGSNKEIIDALSDKERLRWIITKTTQNSDYLTWLNLELSKEQKYDDEVKQNKEIIWNILPVFSQYTNGYYNETIQNIDYQITLDNFTSFIETNILKQHNISSFSPIWIDNISFTDWTNTKKSVNKSSSSNLIWSFVLNLDFQWKNSSISKMIEYIQNSWKLDIQNWKLINKSKINNESNYSLLDNLLMSIDSLTLKSPLLDKDIIWSDGKIVSNWWTISIRFYVRWIWFEQLQTTKQKVIKSIKDLYSEVNNKAKYCDLWNNPLCKDGDWSSAVANLRSLLKDINTLKTKVDLKTKNITKQDIDINQELLEWSSIESSIETLKNSAAKSLNYINNFTKTWAK